MAFQPTLLDLDDAVLTGCSIHAAGGGLPRRIELEGSTGAQAVLADSPSTAFMMDEPSGATLVDAVGGVHNGTIDSATFGTAGKWPGALSLTTTGVRMATSPAGTFAPDGASPYSIEWSHYGNPAAFMAGTMFSGLTVGALSGCQSWFDPGTCYYLLADDAGQYHYFSFSPATYNAADWNVTAVVWSGSGSPKFYINGVEVIPTLLSLGTLGTVTPQPYSFASNALAGVPVGAGVAFDFFAFWNATALTPAQVLAHYEGTLPALSRARWTVPQATGIPVMVCVPGALGRTNAVHPVHAFLSVDGGATRGEVEPDVDLGALTPTGNTVLDVEIDDNTVFIGGASGEGPTLWVEDGAAPGTNRKDWNPINRGMV